MYVLSAIRICPIYFQCFDELIFSENLLNLVYSFWYLIIVLEYFEEIFKLENRRNITFLIQIIVNLDKGHEI